MKNVDAQYPFVVGLFSGKEKLGSASEFLSDFVSEANELLANGFSKGSNNLPVTLHQMARRQT